MQEIELITENLASSKEYSVAYVWIEVAQVAEDSETKLPTQTEDEQAGSSKR